MCVQDGRTPLHYASEKGHTDVVKLLLALKGGEELAKENPGVSVVRGRVCMVIVGLRSNV
jgi:ankyrin repeat protein